MTDRLRMAIVMAFLKVLPTPRLLEGSGASGWMRRACGRTGFDAVWRPLLEAKFGTAAGEVSMAWLWARIHDRTPRLGYLHGGFQRLYEALVAAIERHGGKVIVGAEVTAIVRANDRLAVRWQHGGAEHERMFDRVISTLPPHVTSRLASLPACESRPGAAPLTAQCLVLSLDRPLTGTYWIGGTDPAWPFTAVIEHTALIPPAAYGGRHLVYLGSYRSPDHPLLDATPEGLTSLATAQLQVLNPAFDPSWIADAWAFVAPNAQPVVDPGYRRRLPGFHTAIPGLFAANMFQIYPHDRGQNYSILLAERLVDSLERTR